MIISGNSELHNIIAIRESRQPNGQFNHMLDAAHCFLVKLLLPRPFRTA